MNARRVAMQGLIAGQGALSIATQGFHPINEATGGGISRPSAPDLSRQRRLFREDEEFILMVAAVVASGRLH